MRLLATLSARTAQRVLSEAAIGPDLSRGHHCLRVASVKPGILWAEPRSGQGPWSGGVGPVLGAGSTHIRTWAQACCLDSGSSVGLQRPWPTGLPSCCCQGTGMRILRGRAYSWEGKGKHRADARLDFSSLSPWGRARGQSPLWAVVALGVGSIEGEGRVSLGSGAGAPPYNSNQLDRVLGYKYVEFRTAVETPQLPALWEPI